MLQKLDADQFRALWPTRASHWRGALTTEQYVERNRRIYAQGYGSRIHTWGWVENGKICSSFDTIETSVFVHEQGAAVARPGRHIASFFTPKEFQKQGWGAKLLEAVLARENLPYTLSSGIGTRFYERFGFSAQSVWVQEVKASASATKPPAREISRETLLETLHRARSAQVAGTPGALAMVPDGFWCEWQGSILQFYGEVCGKSVARGKFFELTTDSGPLYIAAMEHWPEKKLLVWWASRRDETLVNFASRLAWECGLAKATWLSESPQPQYFPRQDHPMARGGQLVDAQLWDIW